jgi:hypothetical protein
MPKGPRGEKRPADVIGAAIMVGRIATGEMKDEGYQSPRRRVSGEAGAAARNESLSPERRKEIASNAAESRWSRKEVHMSEKDKLMHTLFSNSEQELVDIKFCRVDGSKAVSEEAFCARVNQIIFEIDTGLTKASDRFLGDSDKTVDVVELAKRLT